MLFASLFVDKKVLLVGEMNEALAFLKVILHLMPESIRHVFGFVINILDVYDETINLYIYDDKEISIDVDHAIEKHLAADGDIVDLREKKVYGEYSSNLTQELNKMLENGASAREIQNHIHAIVEMAQDLEYDDVSEVASSLEIDYSDAELLIELRKQILGGFI